MATAAEPDIKLTAIDAIINRVGSDPHQLIAILQAIQEQYNYLPRPALEHLARVTDIRPADITEVMSFYAQFRDRPAGKHRIKVCVGTACHVKGASAITDAFRRHLAIPDGNDTDAESLFTVEEVACLGCCMLAPAVQVDDLIYGYVEPRNVGSLLQDFLRSLQPSVKTPAEFNPASGAGEVRLCTCSSCGASGADRLHSALMRERTALKLPVRIKQVACTGISYQSPFLEVQDQQGSVFHYGRVTAGQARRILMRHFKAPGLNQRVKASLAGLLEKILSDTAAEPVMRYQLDMHSGPDADYVSCQCNLATAQSGKLNPLHFEEYCSAGGGTALRQVLAMDDKHEIISIVKNSGLRGRGGGGYPTGLKWEQVAQAESGPVYLICNADEGDPGAFMDRLLIESFPFRVLEGILIGATAVNAQRAIIYVRAEYALAIKQLTAALDILKDNKWVGENILDSGRNIAVEIVQGAGAFVCGEETALIAAIEGRRGMPIYRPPYPSVRGLYGKPTLINNVETFALIPAIIREGAEAFAALGTPDSTGTKAFALAGKVARGGLIEVPMGITIRRIVDEIGGGVPDGRQLKAVQIGGPSGGCVPASLADTTIDYEALLAAGAMMGSGGLVVLDDSDCMVDMARYFLTFTRHESCGKCTFCRLGTVAMLEILQRITEGEGAAADLEQLQQLAAQIRAGSLCGLGRTAPNPVLSTLKHFRDEYEAHINGHCPAGVCKALIRYSITDDCIGCTRCSQACPADAIAFTPYMKHSIDAEKCIRCDSCRQVCPSDAVKVT